MSVVKFSSRFGVDIWYCYVGVLTSTIGTSIKLFGMTDQGQSKKLDEELARLGLPNIERGDARDRARVIGVSPAALAHWLAGRKRVPEWIWHFLKLWELAGPEAREELRQWAKQKSK
ncbi:MAG: hypothetical protein ACR2RE_19110 [Geminicoccaceae bacterium]